MIPFSTAIEEDAIPHSSLAFMLWSEGLFVFPLMPLCTVISYTVFRGKVKPPSGIIEHSPTGTVRKNAEASSFRGAGLAREPGIHKHELAHRFIQLMQLDVPLRFPGEGRDPLLLCTPAFAGVAGAGRSDGGSSDESRE
jgi:hypothetical protein